MHNPSVTLFARINQPRGLVCRYSLRENSLDIYLYTSRIERFKQWMDKHPSLNMLCLHIKLFNDKDMSIYKVREAVREILILLEANKHI